MEIHDCGFDTLENIDIFDSPAKGFEGVNWALLVGSKPRGPGMERADFNQGKRPDLYFTRPSVGEGGRGRPLCCCGEPLQHQCFDRTEQLL